MARPWRTAALVGLALLLLVEAVLVPFPGAVPRLDPAALPEAYRWLRAAPPGTVALGVPMGDWVNVAASALHLRRTVNGWASFEPPRYRDLAAAMEAFPDARTLALVRGLGADVVLVDRAWLTPDRAARLAEPGSGLRPERVFPTHVLYRMSGPAPPGPESLAAEARIGGAGPCVALRNAGSDWMPLLSRPPSHPGARRQPGRPSREGGVAAARPGARRRARRVPRIGGAGRALRDHRGRRPALPVRRAGRANRRGLSRRADADGSDGRVGAGPEWPHALRFLERVEPLIDHPLDVNRTERIA